ncbi:transmembrane protein 39A isoform X2 [Neocloeon triangulifer]|uniref:transmembrane protein 39A isoform X2 n=1 Tax=Neocloeon triangulifer TaxID=2078957 RepID=UPI00286F3C15|nr:transmembrane protein 39A isoform X2 [Neocloeon triangulifer]
MRQGTDFENFSAFICFKRSWKKMAGGRKHLANRSHPVRPPSLPCDEKLAALDGMGPSQRHIPMPDIAVDGELFHECLMFMFSSVSCGLQFLHLYRSVWWLPMSNSKYAMNFYLVDPYLVAFIGAMLSRQFVYCLFKKIIVLTLLPTSLQQVADKALRWTLLGILSVVLLICAIFILDGSQVVNILYLGYPASVYLILFGFRIGPFLCSTDHGPDQLKGEAFHSCPSTAPTVRAEADALKGDFNARMRHILFNSVLSAYYAAFIPCCFAQSSLAYDLVWATQHLLFVWLGCFTMAAAQTFPVQYVDVLHRSALHLGKWSKLEGCRSHLPTHIWHEGTVWPSGSLVKYSREIYRAEGVQTVCAEPANLAHLRFYAVFHNPGLLYGTLLLLQGLLVFIQLGLLAHMGSEWWRALSLTLMLFTNYYTLFKATRDTVVSWRLSSSEKLLHSKLAAG